MRRDIEMLPLIVVILTVLGLFAASVVSAKDSCGRSANNFCQVKAIEVYDGDTFYVDIPKLHPLIGQRLGIRVRGVDTPEIRTKSAYEKAKGYKAREFVERVLEKAKRVDLKDCEKGKFFRLVCDVELDGMDLGKMLIDHDLAIPYK